MPPLLDTEVRPGDVISSELFRAMQQKLAELDGRVDALETHTGGQMGEVRILAISPPDQQRVGRDMELAGVNFVVPAASNDVTIDGVRVTQFLVGSTSQLLRFIIPPEVSVAAAGEDVEIRVTNVNRTHAVLYRVLPPIQSPGNPPNIAGITNDDGSQPLRVNQFALINGANFAANAGDNRLTFRVTTQGGVVVYPLDGQQLEIDAGASTTQQIRVRIPDIVEAVLGVPTPVIVELRVGAHPPASVQVTVIRLP